MAFCERDSALEQRNTAIASRDAALKERDMARAELAKLSKSHVPRQIFNVTKVW